jgi:hypothetical protein
MFSGAERTKRYKLVHPDKVRQTERNYRKSHPQKMKDKKARYYLKHREEIRKKAKEELKNLFNLCLDHYGRSCSLCKSENNLVIDHVGGNNGDSPKNYRTLWVWIIKNAFPFGFRTLCGSCNRLDGLIRHHPLLGGKGIDDILEKMRDRSNYNALFKS